MTIFFSGNRFKYEMENVARLFFPLRRFSFVYDSEEYPEADYLAFIRRENVSGGELTVRVREGGFDEAAVSRVEMGEGYENACEMEFARMLYRLLQKITGVTPKWGVLTGIRPVKRLQHAMDSGKSRQQAMDEMTEECLVSNEKAQLAMQIADIQKGLLADLEPRDFSLYVSIPYCPSRCSYCSFVSHSIDHPKARKLLPEYLRFYVDWAGTDYSKDLAEMDLKNHPVFNLEEQLQMFDASEGPSQAQSWQGDLAQFFAAIGRISQDEIKKFENSSYGTDKFLKLIKTPLPSYK